MLTVIHVGQDAEVPDVPRVLLQLQDLLEARGSHSKAGRPRADPLPAELPATGSREGQTPREDPRALARCVQ